MEVNPLASEPAFAVPTLPEAGSIAARLVVAAALGGLLGYERERVGKAAGLRTHMLVALGSALFVLAGREAGMAAPVLVLTARGSWHEKVQGIDGGADDYVSKPFRMEELLARLRALIRRGVK